MELPEILAALATHVTDVDGTGPDEEKVKAVAQEFRSHESPAVKAIAQKLLNTGATRKSEETDRRVKKLEKELKEATDAAEELTQQIEAQKSQPSEKEADLQRRLEKAEAKALKLDGDLKAERDGRKTERVSTKAETVVGSLRGQVDEGYLEEVLRPRIARRLRPADTGEVEVLDEDESPYDGDEKARLQLLGASVLKAVPDGYRIRPGMQPGAGVNSRGGGQGTLTVEQIVEEKTARYGRL